MLIYISFAIVILLSLAESVAISDTLYMGKISWVVATFGYCLVFLKNGYKSALSKPTITLSFIYGLFLSIFNWLWRYDYTIISVYSFAGFFLPVVVGLFVAEALILYKRLLFLGLFLIAAGMLANCFEIVYQITYSDRFLPIKVMNTLTYELGQSAQMGEGFRSTGLSVGNNTAGNYAIFAIPFLISSMLAYKRWRIYFGVALVASFLLLIGSMSRGPTIALISALGLYVLLMKNNRKRVLFFAGGSILLIVLSSVFSEFVSNQLLGYVWRFFGNRAVDSHTILLRYYMYNAAINLILENPIAGIGLGGWSNAAVIGKYWVNDFYDLLIHNNALQLLTGGGILLFSPWLLLNLIAASKCITIAKEGLSKIYLIGIGAVSSFVALFISGLVNCNTQLNVYWIAVGMLLFIENIISVKSGRLVKNQFRRGDIA